LKLYSAKDRCTESDVAKLTSDIQLNKLRKKTHIVINIFTNLVTLNETSQVVQKVKFLTSKNQTLINSQIFPRSHSRVKYYFAIKWSLKVPAHFKLSLH